MMARSSILTFGAVPEILTVTMRQLLGRRRTILLGLLASVPVLLAVIYRAFANDDVKGFVADAYSVSAVTIVLPVVAVLFGTGAFGAEIEDGTIVYLLAKPVARWAIVLAKLFGAAGVTAILTGLGVLVAGVIALVPSGSEGTTAMEAFFVAMVVGSICYTAVLLALSLFIRHALLVGLAYVLVWEAGLTSLLPGIANLSIRQYSLAAAKGIYDGVSTPLETSTGYILAAIVVVAAVAISIWRLRRFELPSGSD